MNHHASVRIDFDEFANPTFAILETLNKSQLLKLSLSQL